MEIQKGLIERPCPICGDANAARQVYTSRLDGTSLDSFAFASRKIPEFLHYRLLRCSACEVLYASPALKPQFLADAYRDAAYDSREEATYAARTYARILHGYLPQTVGRDAALEIGAGTGAFLPHLLHAGFRKVLGIEPSRSAVEAADESIRPLIRLGMFDPAEFKPPSFDLICCFQTLEHLDDPKRICSAAHMLLRPGGALFVVTHNYEARLNKFLGERSPIFDIEHLQLFSPPSLRRLLEASGFQEIQTAAFSNVYSVAYWFKLLPIQQALKRKVLPLLSRLRIGQLPLRANVGNIFAVASKIPARVD